MHRTGGGSLGSCAASRAALPRESRDTGTAATAADQRQRLFHNQHQNLEEKKRFLGMIPKEGGGGLVFLNFM